MRGLGAELDRLRRRCSRLRRSDWAAWSAAVAEANALAQRIGSTPADDLAALLVHFEALSWLMIGADDVIMDRQARAAFIAFGRALRRLSDS